MWLDRGLLFLVGLTLPIEGVGTFHIGSYPVGPAKASTAIFLVYAMARWLFTGQRLPWHRKHVWVVVFAASLLLANLIGGLAGVTVASRFVQWTSYLAVLTFYFLLPWTVRSVRQLEVLLLGLIGGAYLSVLIGFVRPESTIELAEDVERFMGSTNNPNDLAFNLALILPIALALNFTTRVGFKKVFVLGGLVACLVGVVLSLSRAGVLMIAAIGVLYTVRFGGRAAVRYLPPAIAAGAAILMLAPAAFFDRVTSFTEESGREEDSSIQMRLLEYEWGVWAFASNPIIGVGDGRSGRFAVDHGAPMNPNHVIHNVYIDVAAEQGVIGLIPLLMVVGLSWTDYSRIRQWSGDRRLQGDEEIKKLGIWATLFQVSLLAAIVGQQFQPFLRKKEFWLLIGLSSALVPIFLARVREKFPEVLEKASNAPVQPSYVGPIEEPAAREDSWASH